MTVERPLDPTAGERARQIRETPLRPQPILDPTDPRYGLPAVDAGRRPAEELDEEDPATDHAA